MAIQNRFFTTTRSNWSKVNPGDYAGAIVFIAGDSTGSSLIYANGTLLDMGEVDINELKALLGAGSNVTITENDGKLVIAAPGTETITSTSTELVQAKAVAGALTNPVELSLTLSGDVASFAETFGTLDKSGATATATTAKLVKGDNISFESTADGLKISASYENTTYSAGTGLTLDGTTFNHSNSVAEVTAAKSDVTVNSTNNTFTTKSYSYDAQGHVTGSVENTITVDFPEGSDTKMSTVEFTSGTASEATTETVDVVSNVKATATSADGVSASGQFTATTVPTKLYVDNSIGGLDLSYDTTDKVIKLTDKNGNQVGDSIDATEFIKDGMIESVAWKATDENILVITWNTDAGKEDTEINFDKYIDSFSHYGARNGITIKPEGTTSYYEGVVAADSEAFLTVGAGGFKLSGVLTAIETAVQNKNVTASGETGDAALVTASASNNAVTVGSTTKLQTAVSAAETALQGISKGTDGNYVTTTVSEKANKEQSISVAVTTANVAEASSENNGLAVASDVKAYVDAQWVWGVI